MLGCNGEFIAQDDIGPGEDKASRRMLEMHSHNI